MEIASESERGALSAGIFIHEDELSEGLAGPNNGQLLLQSEHCSGPISCDSDINDIAPNDNILDQTRGDCYKYDPDSEFISFNAVDILEFFNIFIDEDYEKFDDRIFATHFAPNSCYHNAISCKECDEMDRTIGHCHRDISTSANIMPESAPAYSVICPTCVTALIKGMDIAPCIKKLDALMYEHIPSIWPAGTNQVKKTFKKIMQDKPALNKFLNLYN